MIMTAYDYPVWVTSVEVIKIISTSTERSVCISLLKCDNSERAKRLLDIRVWNNGKPSRMGVFLASWSLRILSEVITKFLDNDELTGIPYAIEGVQARQKKEAGEDLAGEDLTGDEYLL